MEIMEVTDQDLVEFVCNVEKEAREHGELQVCESDIYFEEVIRPGSGRAVPMLVTLLLPWRKLPNLLLDKGKKYC